MTTPGRGKKSHRNLLDRIADLGRFAVFDNPVALSLDALQAVVELHAPIEYVILIGLPGELSVTECSGCHADGASWPCSTVRVIARHLRVEVPGATT